MPINAIKKFEQAKESLKKAPAVGKATFWKKFYYARNRAYIFWHKTWLALLALFVVAAIPTSYFLIDKFAFVTPDYFTDLIPALRDYFIALGATLIGAGAIAFSFIMFASQINVERMPHHLFWHFSFDKRIIGAFIGIFTIAVSTASFSLAVNASNALALILATFWLILFTIALIIYAYKRTIALINPIKQLTYILDDVKKDLDRWKKGAKRLKPLIQEPKGDDDPIRTHHDLKLCTFFGLHPNWTNKSKQGVDLCATYVQRYSEYGDYVVTKNALIAMAEINGLYIEAKGKTFFASNPFFNIPQSTDGFINHTLEEIRQILGLAFSKKDERLIEQCIETLGRLTILYSDIDYSTDYERGKFHANLAAAYLKNAVQTAVENGLTDVSMVGVRWLGDVATIISQKSQPQDCIQFSKDIMLICVMAFAKQDTRPVTLAGVEQLAKLTLVLLASNDRNVSYALKEVRGNVSTLAQVLVTVPDGTVGQLHSANLGPYYSSTDFQSLSAKLTHCVTALKDADAEDENAANLIINFSNWVDDMHQTEKEVLLAAIKARSHFTFDMIHWIEHISKLSLALSKLPACPDHYALELEKNASWLISVFSWIPDDKETVGFVENYQLVERMFEVAFEAGRRECWDFLESAYDLLLSWAMRTGKYQTGWGSFEKAIYALTALIAVFGNTPYERGSLEDRLFDKLQAVREYDDERKSKLARQIEQRISNLGRRESRYSQIDNALSQQDPETVRPILERVVAFLAGESA